MTLDWSEQQNQRRIDSGVDDPGDAVPVVAATSPPVEQCVFCGADGATDGLCRNHWDRITTGDWGEW